MSSSQSLFESFIIWIIMIVISVTLLFSVAMPWDVMQPLFNASGMTGASVGQWDTDEDIGLLGNLIYVVIYALPIIGGINFFATATRKTEYDTVYER